MTLRTHALYVNVNVSQYGYGCGVQLYIHVQTWTKHTSRLDALHYSFNNIDLPNKAGHHITSGHCVDGLHNYAFIMCSDASLLHTVEDADAVQNLTVAFREDIDIPQQAFVTLSWDSPSG